MTQGEETEHVMECPLSVNGIGPVSLILGQLVRELILVESSNNLLLRLMVGAVFQDSDQGSIP